MWLFFPLEIKCKHVCLNGIIEAGIIWWVLVLCLLILCLLFSSLVEQSALAERLGFILGQNRWSVGSAPFSVMPDRLEISVCHLLNSPKKIKSGLFWCLQRSSCHVWLVSRVCGEGFGLPRDVFLLKTTTEHGRLKMLMAGGKKSFKCKNWNSVLSGWAVEEICKHPSISLLRFRCSWAC